MPNDLAELLYQAYASEFGVVVETDDPEFLRQKLYAIRKDNPDLLCLAFVISPLNGADLWILRKEPNGGQES